MPHRKSQCLYILDSVQVSAYQVRMCPDSFYHKYYDSLLSHSHTAYNSNNTFVSLLFPSRFKLGSVGLAINFIVSSTIVSPYFSHFEVSNGSYIGIITLTLGSGEGCSMNSFLTGTLFQLGLCFLFLQITTLVEYQEQNTSSY